LSREFSIASTALTDIWSSIRWSSWRQADDVA
jgi:hypothetical protein